MINISSQAIRGAVRGVHYSASKGGVVSMTRAMALELAPHNIRVNAIAPGTTDTAQPRYGNTEAELIEMARTIPLGGKMLSPDQIARTAVFLASEDANAITGQVLHVNGGTYMSVKIVRWLHRWEHLSVQTCRAVLPAALPPTLSLLLLGSPR